MEALLTLRLFLGGFLLLVSLLPGAKAHGCPRGWREYKGHCYGFFNLKVTWMKAELGCQSIRSNSHLASIASEEETDLLSKYIDENYNEQKAIWFGMYENQTGTPEKRYFRWVDQTPLSYTSWAPGEPHNLEEQCAALAKPDFKFWISRRCGHHRPYLCKYAE